MYNKIFISYAKEDYKSAEKLFEFLISTGIYSPWLDKKNLYGGQNWEIEIKTALKKSDFIIILLSKTSVAKRGFVQREFKLALEFCEEKLDSDIYIIPCKIDDCEVPEKLSKFQWIELSKTDSFERILSALNLQRKKYEDYDKTTKIDELNEPNIDFETINMLTEQVTNGMRETYNAVTITFNADNKEYYLELEKQFIITSDIPPIRYTAQFYANKFLEDATCAREYYKENVIQWNDLDMRASIRYKQPKEINYSCEEQLVIQNMVSSGNYIPFDILFETKTHSRIPLLKDTKIILKYCYRVPIRFWGNYINRTMGLYKIDAVVRFVCDDKLPDLKYSVFRLNSGGAPMEIDAYEEVKTMSSYKKITELKIPTKKSFSKYRVVWDAHDYFGIDEKDIENVADQLGVTNK